MRCIRSYAYPVDLIELPMESTSSPPPLSPGQSFEPALAVSESFHEVSRLMAEGRAVAMACEAIEGRENPLKVQQFVKALIKNQPTELIEDYVTWCAMMRICGSYTPTPPYTDEDTGDQERSLFLVTAWAWMMWASGSSKETALKELESVDLFDEGSSVLHHIALSNWAMAIIALLKDDLTEAKRRYRRAIDVGGQFGTDTNSTVVWTYAATFFRTGI